MQTVATSAVPATLLEVEGVSRDVSKTRVGDIRWLNACNKLAAAAPEPLRQHVTRALHGLHNGGFGLRSWVSSMVARGTQLTDSIPADLIQVYLTDPEAVPLHDCEDCGIAIPVRPNRHEGAEGEPEQVYFPSCPVCGGRTGWYMWWARQTSQTNGSDGNATLRRRKPR